MIPQSISFTCSGNPGLNVTLDDKEGVTLKSDKNITMTAPNEFIMKTETRVTIKAVSKLEVQRENKQAGISLENKTSCFGDTVHENGSSTELFTSFSHPLEIGGR
jgi:preprotein translocase subunit SecB